MALQLRITIILVTILATCWQLSSTLAASLQTDQEKVLVLAAAQQQQSQWQSGAATSSTTNNNDNDNGLSTILMKKMRPTTEWLLNNNVTRDYLGASVCSLVLTPFLTMEFLEQVQDVPIATITPSRDQVLVAASSAFLLWMASSTIPITFSPIILRVCTSLWARSCMFIIAFLGLLAFMNEYCYAAYISDNLYHKCKSGATNTPSVRHAAATSHDRFPSATSDAFPNAGSGWYGMMEIDMALAVQSKRVE
ncbi:hypothetical protein Vafri_17443 [Volvox africanus]|uniref:Membrane-associated protein n=1 Tax=Volvox africanus TaxID=51714 RepID=A0A8J4F7G9_9CHLO|nr:hypothetical protein Vafri_17443 [Volvox africanus]